MADEAGSVGTIFAKMVLDNSGFLTGLKQSEEAGTKSSNLIDKSLSKIGNTLRNIAYMTASALGVAGLISYAKEAMMLSARVDTLSIVIKSVGINAGYTTSQMKLFVEQTKKQGITTQAAMDSVIKMAQAQMDLAQTSKLARIAQDAAVIGNTNSSDAFQRMIYGIKTGQTEILRTIGINVSFEQSYSRLATQLKKNAASLSESEKVQARMNGVLQEGVKIEGVYEAALTTAGKAIHSLKRYTEELQLKLGEVFQPALKKVVDTLTESFKGAGEAVQNFIDSGKMASIASTLAEGITILINVLAKLSTILIYTANVIATFKDALLALAVGFAVYKVTAFITSLLSLSGVMAEVAAGTSLTSVVLTRLGTATAGLQAMMLAINPVALGIAVVIGTLYWAYQRLTNATAEAEAAYDSWKAKVAKFDADQLRTEIKFITENLQNQINSLPKKGFLERWFLGDEEDLRKNAEAQIMHLNDLLSVLSTEQNQANIKKQLSENQKVLDQAAADKQSREDQQNAANLASLKARNSEALASMKRTYEAEAFAAEQKGKNAEEALRKEYDFSVEIAKKERSNAYAEAALEASTRKAKEQGKFNESAFWLAKTAEIEAKYRGQKADAELQLTKSLVDLDKQRAQSLLSYYKDMNVLDLNYVAANIQVWERQAVEYKRILGDMFDKDEWMAKKLLELYADIAKKRTEYLIDYYDSIDAPMQQYLDTMTSLYAEEANLLEANLQNMFDEQQSHEMAVMSIAKKTYDYKMKLLEDELSKNKERERLYEKAYGKGSPQHMGASQIDVEKLFQLNLMKATGTISKVEIEEAEKALNKAKGIAEEKIKLAESTAKKQAEEEKKLTDTIIKELIKRLEAQTIYSRGIKDETGAKRAEEAIKQLKILMGEAVNPVVDVVVAATDKLANGIKEATNILADQKDATSGWAQEIDEGVNATLKGLHEKLGNAMFSDEVVKETEDAASKYAAAWKTTVNEVVEKFGQGVDFQISKYKELLDVFNQPDSGAAKWTNAFSEGISDTIILMQKQAMNMEKISSLQKEMEKTPVGSKERLSYEKKIGAIQEDNFKDQISGYRKLAGVIGNTFNEGSKEREAFHKIEMGLAAIEMAMEVKNLAFSLLAITTKTTAEEASVAPTVAATMIKAAAKGAEAVATQLAAGPYIGFAMAAAAIALLAGLGIMLSGGGSSSGSSKMPKVYEPAEGTVLGAKEGTTSESLSKSLEIMEETYDMENVALNRIYQELRSLNSGIKGLVSSIFRTGGTDYSTIAGGLKVGSYAGAGEGVAEAMWSGIGHFLGVKEGLVGRIEDFLSKPAFHIAEFIFGGDKEVTLEKGGIEIGATVVKNILNGMSISARKFALYKIEEESGLFGGGSTKWKTVYERLDNSVVQSLTKVFDSLGTTLETLAEEFGTNIQNVYDYVFETTKINLKGMDAEEASKMLSSYFNDIADKAAKDLFGSIISQYQEVGEALFETAVRLVKDKNIVQEILELTNTGIEFETESIRTSRMIVTEEWKKWNEERIKWTTGVAGFFHTISGEEFDLAEPTKNVEEFYDVIVTGTQKLIAFGESLIEKAGGLDNLVEYFNTYYEAFIDETEKQTDLADKLVRVLKDVNVEFPKTREEYKDLVELLSNTETMTESRMLVTEEWQAWEDARVKWTTGIEGFFHTLLGQEFNLTEPTKMVEEFYTGMDEVDQEAYITLLRMSGYADEFYKTQEEALEEAADAQKEYVDSLKEMIVTIDEWLASLNLSELNPGGVTAAGYNEEYVRKANIAFAEGATTEQMNDFLNYATDYLNFMKTYTGEDAGDYKAIYDSVVQDVNILRDAVNAAIVANGGDPVVNAVTEANDTLLGISGTLDSIDQTLKALSLSPVTAPFVDLAAPISSATATSSSITELPSYGDGGLTSGLSYAGERGREWIVPTYEPERSSFLESVGVNPEVIGKSIARAFMAESSGGNEGGKEVHVHLYIDRKEITDSVVAGIRSGDEDLVKNLKKVVN